MGLRHREFPVEGVVPGELKQRGNGGESQGIGRESPKVFSGQQGIGEQADQQPGQASNDQRYATFER